jgi:hypothetical protein
MMLTSGVIRTATCDPPYIINPHLAHSFLTPSSSESVYEQAGIAIKHILHKSACVHWNKRLWDILKEFSRR